MARPRLPPRLNLTGTALPAFAAFGPGPIGEKKPVNGHVIVKSAFETSKKTLPTASTLIRACVVGDVRQRHRLASRRSASLAASTYGYVWPPSVDSVIFTFAVLTGATSVPATSQVTVCVEPRR